MSLPVLIVIFYVYTHIPSFALLFGEEVSLNITRDLYCVFYNYVTFGDIQEYVYPTDQKINIHCNISIMWFTFDIFIIYHL